MLFAVLIYFDCHLYTSVSKPSWLVIHQIEKEVEVLYTPVTWDKSYSELTLADDFMFWKVMSRPAIAKQFLESLFRRSIKSIEFSGGQSTHKEFANRPGVRFDVEFHGDGKIYDIEMQNSGSSSEKGILELINRARYYHAMLTQSKYDRRRGLRCLA